MAMMQRRKKEKKKMGLMRGNFCMNILYKPSTFVHEICPAHAVGHEIEGKPILYQEEDKTGGQKNLDIALLRSIKSTGFVT